MLNSKLQYTQGSTTTDSSLGLSPAETAAGREVLPELERLRIRAVAKVYIIKSHMYLYVYFLYLPHVW